MTHLTPDELIDAAEADADRDKAGTALTADRQAHLAGCPDCRRQLGDLQSALGAARQVGVPEPSPLFWPQFSRRVSDAIESTPENGSAAWLRWQVLLPLGAVAMLILALMMSVPKDARVPAFAPVAQEAPVAQVAPAESDSWDMVADLVGQLDVETASAEGVIEPGVAERAALELTAEEQLELTRLLKEELTRAKS
jgi:hypothetical protein